MMEISRGINIVDTALWISKEKILIINDLHWGYEESLHQKGILLPKHQLKEIIEKMQSLLDKIHPKIIIINGDIKHEFGRILQQEWKEVLQFFDFLSKKSAEIIIIRGNHDPLIKPLAEKRKIEVVSEYLFGDTIIIHGDGIIKTKARRIIIGHEHPAITIREAGKREKYKCFLKGKWKGKELITVPSFNPLVEGTDILKEQILSPFLKNISSFEVFVVNKGEVFNFGKLKNINK